MKLMQFILIAFLTVFSTAAQAPYKVSKPYKVFDFDHNFYVTKNSEMVLIKFIRSQCVIQRFDTATPELIKETRYQDFFANGFRIEDFKEVGGKFYFFYSLANKEKKCEEMLAQEVDFEKAEFINPPKAVLCSEGKPKLIKSTYYLHKNRTEVESNYAFIQPKDKSNLLIRYSTFLNGKEDGSIKITLIDKNLAALYSKTIPFDIKSDIILADLVDANGNFYLASKKNIKGEKEDAYKIYLNTLKSNSNDLATEELPLDGKFVNEISIGEFNNEIICAGFSSDFDSSKKAFFSLKKSVTNNSNGLVVFKSNLDGKITANFKSQIPEKIINFYKNQPNANYVENAFLHDFEITKNGDMIIVGEQFVSEQENPSGYNIYGDILICKVDKNGKLDFATRLPKAQASANESQPFSFKAFYSDNYLYLPFIDNIKNLEDTTSKIKEASGDLILSRIALKDGKIARKFILNIGVNGNNLNKFSVNRFYKSDLNSFSFDAYKKDKEDVMLTVDFN